MTYAINLKVTEVIDSCKTYEQWKVANKFYERAIISTDGIYRDNLYQVVWRDLDAKLAEIIKKKNKPDPLRFC